MRSYLPTDLPRFVAPEVYEQTVADIAAALRSNHDLVSLYRIGSVASPGISDIDMVAVFRDGAGNGHDARRGIGETGRYLFVHSLYGASQSDFLRAQPYSFFSPYQLVFGKELLQGNVTAADPLVRLQVAFEYLSKLFINYALQDAYGLLRIRSLLLHGKGAAIDLGYLSPNDHEWKYWIDPVMEWRKQWFTKPPSASEMTVWLKGFLRFLENFLHGQLARNHFYLPADKEFRLGRNLIVKRGERYTCTARGIRPAFMAPLLGKKYLNLLNRLNRVTITLPYQTTGIPQPVLEYFEFNELHRANNRLHLPGYLPLTSSLHLR